MFDEMHKSGQTMNARKALKMLMKRAQIIDGELRFPFQEDDKFMYWCLNKIMRSEALYNATLYINKQLGLKSVDDLKELLTKNNKPGEISKLLQASLRTQAGTA